MSSKLKTVFIFSSLFSVGYGSSWILSKLKSDQNIIAKKTSDPNLLIEKHLMPLMLTVQGPDAYPEDSEKPVTLKATIHTPFAEFTNIHYNWVLPENVEIVKGYLTSDIQNPLPNKIYVIEISVKGFNSLERKEISLMATTVDPQGARLGNSVIITSRPEDSMEHIAPIMMVKAQEFKASQDQDRMPASKEDE